MDSIGQQTNTALGIFTFSVKNLPVARWRIETVGNEPAGFAIDNVCFTLGGVKQFLKWDSNNLGNNVTPASVSDTDLSASEISQDDEDSDEPETPNLQPNATPTTVNSDSVSLNPSDVSQQSCQGIGTPLDANTLTKIARQLNPHSTQLDIQNAFEAFALDSIMADKYTGSKLDSPERAAKTKGKRSSVVPDAIGTVVVIDYAPFGYGPPIPIPYPNSAILDAKVLPQGKSIRLSESRYQAQGFLDYLSHYSPAALAPVPLDKHPTGDLVYATTAGAGISSGTLNYAGDTPGVPFTPVAVYQAVACLLNTNGNYTGNYLQMGHGILLNGYRFDEYPELQQTLPAGRPSHLQSPKP